MSEFCAIDMGRGEVVLASGRLLKKGLRVDDFLSWGESVVGDVVVGNGWRRVGFGPCVLFDRPVHFILMFLNDELRRLNVSVDGIGVGRTPSEGKEFQDALLRADFGIPSSESEKANDYAREWGHLGSSIDMHQAFSTIYMVWNE